MNRFLLLFLTLSLSTSVITAFEVYTPEISATEVGTWIRVNQVGYLPDDIKVAVFISLSEGMSAEFKLYDAMNSRELFSGRGVKVNADIWGMKSAFRFDFSDIKREGGYYIVSNGIKSPTFKVDAGAYDGLSDFLLEYMRQQRCGDNPYTGEICHDHDGYIVGHPTRDGEYVDVTGGWHDATDYLQYQTTSATALYHLMFSWMEQKDKSVFRDMYDARGRRGSNGIADIVDEIRWGLEWLMKMNPEDKVMFNQIADDRDHAGFRKPQDDKVDYGWGPGTGRPVYFVTGEPQGLGKYINRTTGVASTAGKFASSFALGSELFKDIDPQFAAKMKEKSLQAYAFAEERPGNTQTACLKSPYFYEEDTYVDDIELAAATLYHYGDNSADWRKRADYWGELEPVTPWMELGRGRHYQFYPFINLGHYYLAKSEDRATAEKFTAFMRDGLEHLRKRAADDPFIYGIPFLWCSNNLVSAAITQSRLYRETSGDNSYLEMEMALRDWLLGCNPWGTSMIVGLPEGGDYPLYPHSSYTVANGDLTYGGLVDGPIYRQLFLDRAGNALTKPDEYAPFNNGRAVYHDDIGDYSSNEPTMDGTAGLSFYFASTEAEAKAYRRALSSHSVEKDDFGAIVRIRQVDSGVNAVKENSAVKSNRVNSSGSSEAKVIYLIFSADSMFNGGASILKTLDKNKIKGSFFLTGNFLRMASQRSIIEKIVFDGHYVGAHSDKHLLYAPWEKRSKSLVSADSLITDLKQNYRELAKFGIEPSSAVWYLPPYEYYNKESVNLISSLGLKTINYTPGTATPADYTTSDMANYRSSAELIRRLFDYEKSSGLDGAIILIHPGVEAGRPDPLFEQLDDIIKRLKKMGYEFRRLD